MTIGCQRMCAWLAQRFQGDPGSQLKYRRGPKGPVIGGLSIYATAMSTYRHFELRLIGIVLLPSAGK